MRIFSILLSASLFMLQVSGASAQNFTNGYADWQKLTRGERVWYVSGMLEGASFAEKTPASEAVAFGLMKCSLRLKLTNGMLEQAITKHYENNPSSWGLAPFFVFWDIIVRGACLGDVNNERSQRNLELFRPQN